MKTHQAYNEWSKTYDEMANKTRDLEKKAAKISLSGIPFKNVLEIGCGTGKNTEWLSEKAESIIALDFSEEMLAIARKKIDSSKVKFVQADINNSWKIPEHKTDLIVCSLVLEHISDLEPVFRQASEQLITNGHFYLCELHPYKQYAGSKARFTKDGKLQETEVFTHHVSDYVNAAMKNGFTILELQEWFDEGSDTGTPRLISFIFAKHNME